MTKGSKEAAALFGCEPVESRSLNAGIQHRFEMPNGYGASVVQGPCTYGGNEGYWELAVLRRNDTGEWPLTYETPITDDVIGYLNAGEVADLLHRVAALGGTK